MTYTLNIRPYRHPDDEEAVIRIWQRCQLVTALNNPRCDIDRKLRVLPELFLVGTLDETVVATCMAGYEGHRGWINYLAVDPAHQQHGFGRILMEAAEAALKALGCPKINSQVRETNTGVIAFYERLGFQQDRVLSMGKRLGVDPAIE